MHLTYLKLQTSCMQANRHEVWVKACTTTLKSFLRDKKKCNVSLPKNLNEMMSDMTLTAMVPQVKSGADDVNLRNMLSEICQLFNPSEKQEKSKLYQENVEHKCVLHLKCMK